MLAERAVQAVLLDPVAYYRPWATRARGLSPATRAAINHDLVQRWGLPHYAECEPGQDVLTRRLLNSWAHLPSAAYLIACAKWRSQLSASRLYLDQPAIVRAFMQIGTQTVDAGRLPPGALSRASLLGWGGEYLLDVVEMAPEWLSSRVRLMFAGLDSLLPKGSETAVDMNCFWRALSYAACDSGLRQYLGD